MIRIVQEGKVGEIISEDSFQGIFAAEYKKWNGRVCKGFKMRG